MGQTITWKTNAASSDWNLASNWVEGVIPTSTSDVVITLCAFCPNVPANTTIKSININAVGGNGGINLQGNTLTVSGSTQLKYAVINGGGKIISSEISQVMGNTFNNGITLQKTAGSAAIWSGGNVFNGPTFIILDTPNRGAPWSLYNYLTTSAQGDTFNGEVTFINYAWSLKAVSTSSGSTTFNNKVTFINNTASYYQSSFLYTGGTGKIICKDEVIINNPSGGIINAINTNNNITFEKAVSINNTQHGLEITYMTYGNTINIGGGSGQTCVFDSPVTVTNTSQRSTTYTPVDVNFNTNGGKCIFKSSFAIGTGGFRKGNFNLRNCEFETTALTTLNLSSPNLPEAYTSQLIIGAGTTFTGPLQVKAPHLLLNGGIFNGEAHFTKTRAGINNSVGGNTFKKKLTIINQASGSSPVNLATQTSDYIQN